MARAVYLESSVISYLTSRDTDDVIISARKAITELWWTEQKELFHNYISVMVLEEISKGDGDAVDKRLAAINGIDVLETTEVAVEIAKALVAGKGIPKGSEEDALHIGIAASSGMEFLLTWNFRHINNARTKARIGEIVESNGYVCPILCSPEELSIER